MTPWICYPNRQSTWFRSGWYVGSTFETSKDAFACFVCVKSRAGVQANKNIFIGQMIGVPGLPLTGMDREWTWLRPRVEIQGKSKVRQSASPRKVKETTVIISFPIYLDSVFLIWEMWRSSTQPLPQGMRWKLNQLCPRAKASSSLSMWVKWGMNASCDQAWITLERITALEPFRPLSKRRL